MPRISEKTFIANVLKAASVNWDVDLASDAAQAAIVRLAMNWSDATADEKLSTVDNFLSDVDDVIAILREAQTNLRGKVVAPSE